MFASLFAFLVVAALYVIMAENGSSSEPLVFSLRGSTDGGPMFRRLREEENIAEPIIEGMTVTIPAPSVRRLYYNGDAAYCVCDNEKCSEILKKRDDDGEYRYLDHLLFMKASFLQSGDREEGPDTDTLQNAALYMRAIV
jgi:hypothetical protein